MDDNLTPSQKDELLWQAGQIWGPLPWADVKIMRVPFHVREWRVAISPRLDSYPVLTHPSTPDIQVEAIRLVNIYPTLHMGYGPKTQTLVYAEPDR